MGERKQVLLMMFLGTENKFGGSKIVREIACFVPHQTQNHIYPFFKSLKPLKCVPEMDAVEKVTPLCCGS